MTWIFFFFLSQEQIDFRGRDISIPLFQLLTTSHVFAFFSSIFLLLDHSFPVPLTTTASFFFLTFHRLHVACFSSLPRLFFVALLVQQTMCKLLSRQNLQTQISWTKRCRWGPLAMQMTQIAQIAQISSDCIAPIDSSGRQANGQQSLNLQRSHR